LENLSAQLQTIFIGGPKPKHIPLGVPYPEMFPEYSPEWERLKRRRGEWDSDSRIPDLSTPPYVPEYAISIVPRQNFLAANSAENDGGDDAKALNSLAEFSHRQANGEFEPEEAQSKDNDASAPDTPLTKKFFPDDYGQEYEYGQTSQSNEEAETEKAVKHGPYDERFGRLLKPGQPRFEPLDPPLIRKDYFNTHGTEWWEFQRALDNVPDMTAKEHAVYATIFGTEGGLATAGNGASSGITREALKDTQKRGNVKGIEGITEPSELNIQQRVDVMRDYTDHIMRLVDGGSKALDKLDYETAASVTSTLYHLGMGKGAEVLSNAIEEVNPDADLGSPAGMGPKTFEAVKEINDDPVNKWDFIEKLADLRQEESLPEDKNMIDFYRFRERRFPQMEGYMRHFLGGK
jgi:hypothetical protein